MVPLNFDHGSKGQQFRYQWKLLFYSEFIDKKMIKFHLKIYSIGMFFESTIISKIPKVLTWDIFCNVLKYSQIHKNSDDSNLSGKNQTEMFDSFPCINKKKLQTLYKYFFLLHLLLYDLCETRHKKSRRWFFKFFN